MKTYSKLFSFLAIPGGMILSAMLLSTTILSITSPAFAGATTIEALNVTHLPANQTLYVFYSSGRPPAIDVGGSPIIRSVMYGPIKAAIGSDGSASLPQATFPRIGFQIANYLVFVVTASDQSTVYLHNADGSFPTDARIADPTTLDASAFTNEKTGFITVTNLEGLKGSSSTINVDFNRDVLKNDQ